MSKLHFFLAASWGLLSLLLLRPAASGHCEVFPSDACQKSTSFVPGHHLIGKGFDITTLRTKPASVVDTSRWQGPNGTCTLCQNPLMDSEWQRRPLAAADWGVRRACHQQTVSSVEHSEFDVANAVASEVGNDWKLDLKLPTDSLALAGSRSQITRRAYECSQKDSYSFIKHETYCKYYQLQLPSSPASSLASHFSHDVSSLPVEYHPNEYQRFLNVYGTHYVSQVSLGAQKRHLFAVRNCEAALNGWTVSDFKDCLDFRGSLNASQSPKCQQLWKDHTRGDLQSAFIKWNVAVMGGAEPEKALFAEAHQQHTLGWLASAKRHPEVVSYSLLSLHTLLRQGDPKRMALKQAISQYVTERAFGRSCDQWCPYNGFRNPKDHCVCTCHANSLTDNMCCARERGKAQLKFHVQRGANLYGDDFSATDGYVKVFFQGRERRTRIIDGNNNPQWHETLDFGTVTLTRHNTYELEVWDSDPWEDDPLQRFWGELKAGGPYQLKRYLTYGHVEFSYELACAPTLDGPACQTYNPLKRPASSSQNTSPRFTYSGTGSGQKQTAEK